MSFLSSEQRQRALRQIDKADDLLVADLQALSERIAEVGELRRCLAHNSLRISAADAGDAPVDEIQECDDYARGMMERGITHCPVVVTSGEKQIVKVSN